MSKEIVVPYSDPTNLWAMSPNEFNEWRSKNDVPLLLAFFKEKLPFFREWLQSQKIKDDFFCRLKHTGQWFYGNIAILIESNFQEDKHKFWNRLDIDVNEWKTRKYRSGEKVPEYFEFEPYFVWVKRKWGNKRWFKSDPLNPSYVDSFQYNQWNAYQAADASRAYLFKEFSVLKLGGVHLRQGTIIGERNLDFVDLDYLIVSEEWHGPYATEINYSSMQHLTFAGTSLHHWTLRNCALSDLAAKQSVLQNFELLDCDGTRNVFEKCTLQTFSWIRNWLPELVDCKFIDFKFVPPKARHWKGLSDQYRRLRNAYQAKGMRHEAALAYANERKFERKALYSPYFEQSKIFPTCKYRGHLADLYSQWRRGNIANDVAKDCLISVVVSKLKTWLFPRYIIRALHFKVRWFASLMEALLWGYGEKPARILMSCLLVILGYAAVYFGFYEALQITSAAKSYPNQLIDALYFSIVTFTTFGFGDIIPTTTALKLVSASEALVGVFLMGMVVAGFCNRSRY